MLKILKYLMLVISYGLNGNSLVALAQDPIRQTKAADLVVLDRIEILGSAHTSRDLLETYLNLPFASPITQERLQEHLAKFKLSLETLGYFKKVDVRLAKGNTRNHYIVVVDLEPISWFYTGLTNAYSADKEKDVFKYGHFHQKAYMGSRNLFGTGKMLDLSLDRLDFSRKIQSCSIKGQSQRVGALYLDPSLDGSPYLAGVGAGVSDFIVKYQGCDALFNVQIPKSIKETNKSYLAVVGRRFGLTTLSFKVNSIQLSNKKDTSLGLAINYSEKSYLSAVESGSVLKATISGDSDATQKSIGIEGEDTRFLSPTHALTGMVRTHWTRFNGAIDSSYADMNLSLLYQWVSPWSWVFGLNPDSLFTKNSEPQYGLSLTADYISPSFLLNFAITVGETAPPGLEKTKTYRPELP